jgi:hypothetical protein
VLHTPQDDHELSGRNLEALWLARFVAIVHTERALDHQEEFVLLVVVVPGELALKLDEFDVLPVQFAGDPGLPAANRGARRGPMCLKLAPLLPRAKFGRSFWRVS